MNAIISKLTNVSHVVSVVLIVVGLMFVARQVPQIRTWVTAA